MRLLLLNSYFQEQRSGGTEVVLQILAQGLARRGHQVCVVSTTAEAGGAHQHVDHLETVKLGIRNLYWPLDPQSHPVWERAIWHLIDRYNPRAADDVCRIASEFDADLISLHNLAGFSSAVWPFLSKLGRPMAQMLHDYQLICPNVAMFKNGKVCQSQCTSCGLFRGPYRRLSNAVDAVIASSQSVLDIYRREGYFLDVARQVVIRNARSLRRPEDVAVDSNIPKRDNSVLTFGFIGSLAVIKGIEPLLTTFARFADESKRPVRLLVAGDGKDDFAESLKRRFSNPRIVFLGRVDPAHFYPVLDVAVVPSLCHDTFPFVVYEALGFGVPVIGSRRGGIPEVVQHGKTGLLFEPNEADGLLQAMKMLSDEPQLRDAMAQLAPSTVTHLMDEDRFVREHEALYQELVNAGSRPRSVAAAPAAFLR